MILNENNQYAAKWLANLMDAGEIPRGTIDTRSIEEVTADDIEGHDQAHFFAGIGGWPVALRLAGWPDDVRVWTGSCPCQPFSCAGKNLGEKDDRHLWPHFFRLIRECRPDTVFGEQVANAIGKGWLDGISADLEGEGYAVGAVVLGSHSIGAPHIRQRLFWVADSGGNGQQGAESASRTPTSMRQRSAEHSIAGRLGDTGKSRLPLSEQEELSGAVQVDQGRTVEQPGGSWSDSQLAQCRDGKARRIPSAESGIQPLVDGIPRKMAPMLAGLLQLGVDPVVAKRIVRLARSNRPGCLRGAGNAIVPQLAAEFIRAFTETKPERKADG